LNEFERGQIAALNATGMPHRQIEDKLFGRFRKSREKKWSGLPKKVTPRGIYEKAAGFSFHQD
jgi:hypothetical protein